MDALAQMFLNFLAFLPRLVGAALLLTAGWASGSLLAGFVQRRLRSSRWEHALEQSGVGDLLRRNGTGWSATKLAAELVRWSVFWGFALAAAMLLGILPVPGLVHTVASYLPNLAAAFVLLVVSTVVAKVVAGRLRAALAEAGVGNPNVGAALAQYAIIALAAVAALNHLGIAAVVVNTLFIGVVGAVALALGLAFGLGGRDVAAQITQSWYEGNRSVPRRTRQPAAPVAHRTTTPEARREVREPVEAA